MCITSPHKFKGSLGQEVRIAERACRVSESRIRPAHRPKLKAYFGGAAVEPGDIYCGQWSQLLIIVFFLTAPLLGPSSHTPALKALPLSPLYL